MANKVNTNNNDDFQQELADYEAHMQQELTDAEALIQAMKNAQSQEGQYQSQLNSIEHELSELRMEYGIFGPGMGMSNTSFAKIYFSSLYNEMQNDKGQIANLEGQVHQAEAALQAIDPGIDPTIINQLNDLLAQTDDLVNQNLRGDDLNRAIQQTTVIFSQLCDVLMNSIRVDLAQAAMEKFGDSTDPGASAAIMHFAGIAIQAEFQEQFSLQNIQTDVINDEVGWNQEKSSAEADLKTGHWYDFFTGGGPDTGKDHAEIRAADAMIAILNEVESTISPLIAVVDPGMQEFKIELDELKKKIQSIIANGGSIQQIKDAMVEALSILTAIIAETQKDASQYDKEMNQGSMATSQMQLNDSLSQEEVIEDAKKYAAIMGKLLTAVKYIAIAVVFLMNPGIAMAVMTAIELALQASGVMDKLQNALENSKLGGIGGDVMMCLIEVTATAGGAAGIDAVIARQAAKAAADATAETIEKIAEEAVQQASKVAKQVAEKVTEKAGSSAAEAGGSAGVADAAKAGTVTAEQSMNAGKAVAKETMTKCLQQVERKVAIAFMNKTVPELMTSVYKGEFRVMMETAMKEAAQTLSKSEDLEMLVETAAKNGSKDVIGDEEMTSLAAKFANKGVAEAFDVSEESVAKMSKMTLLGERTAGKKFASRAAFAAIASMGSVGLPTDFAALSQHKDKKDLSEGWQIAMQVIQALMQLIGTLGQTDANVGLQTLSSPGVLNKIYTGTSVAQGGLEAIGSAGVADADFEQAGAVKALAKDQSVMDMMQFIMEQLKKDGQLQRDQYSKEMQQTSKTTLNLAMHFNDANQDVAEALSVLPV